MVTTQSSNCVEATQFSLKTRFFVIDIGKISLLFVQLCGLAMSAFFLAVTYTNPNQVEERLQAFAIAKVEFAVDAAWQTTATKTEPGGRLEQVAALSSKLGLEAQRLEVQRQQIVPALLSYSLSENCKENCAFWKEASALTNSAMLARAAQFRIGQNTLQDFVIQRYQTTVAGLLLDLWRFGLLNFVALSLMVALVLVRNQTHWKLTAFACALTGYMGWATYGYIFKQNWALSILLQDWAAPSHQTMMVLVAFLLADLLFWQGQITSALANAITSLIPG